VTLGIRCTDLPAVEGTPPPHAERYRGQQGGTPDGQSSSATQGCYLFQRPAPAPELTITFADQATGQAQPTFTVPGQGEVEKCFDPGTYSCTLDAPPPWSLTNDVLAVQPGDQFLFPILPSRTKASSGAEPGACSPTESLQQHAPSPPSQQGSSP
jgi:serine protease Do